MKIRNPEFLRNVWLEITPHRLIGTPLFIWGVFVLAGLLSAKALTMLWICLVAQVMVIGTYGSQCAFHSLRNEYKTRTWTTQRLTSISPWSMTWGKMFGSTIYIWYMWLCLFVVYLVLAVLVANQDLEGLPRQWGLIQTAIFFMGISLAGPVVGLMGAFSKNPEGINENSRSSPGGIFLVSILFVGPIFFSLLLNLPQRSQITWYGEIYSTGIFLILSLYAYLGWGFWADYYLMRNELKVKNLPWSWLLFHFFSVAWVCGFGELNEDAFWTRAFTAFLISVVFTYCLGVVEKTGLNELRRLLFLKKKNRTRDFLCELPRGCVSLIITLVLLAWIVVAGEGPTFPQGSKDSWSYSLVAPVVFMFMLRDGALLMFFRFGRSPHRAEITTAVYLVTLYAILPLFLYAMDWPKLIPWFAPVADFQDITAWNFLLPATIPALAMCFVTFTRWKKVQAKHSSSS